MFRFFRRKKKDERKKTEPVYRATRTGMASYPADDVQPSPSLYIDPYPSSINDTPSTTNESFGGYGGGDGGGSGAGGSWGGDSGYDSGSTDSGSSDCGGGSD